MDEDIRQIVRRVSVLAAGLGFALALVPTADGVVLVPVHAGMIVAIARARRRPLAQLPLLRLAGTVAVSSAVRSAATLALRLGPRAGRLSGAVTAVALTRFLAAYTDRLCDAPDDAPDVSLRDLWNALTTRDPAPV